MTMKSSPTCAARPARILSQKTSTSSWVCTTSLPNSEFFFSPVLSSMIVAEIPSRSMLRTFSSKCSGLPPVSASMISGLVVTSKISLIPVSRLLISSASMSGLPRTVESVSELDQKPSNSRTWSSACCRACSAISAEIGLCASMKREIGLAASSRRRVARRRSGVVPSACWRWAISVEETPSV